MEPIVVETALTDCHQLGENLLGEVVQLDEIVLEGVVLGFVEGFAGSARVNAYCAIGVRVSVAEVEGVLGVFIAACGNQEVRAPNIDGSLYDFVSIRVVMFIGAELLIGEVGCDIKEGPAFG